MLCVDMGMEHFEGVAGITLLAKEVQMAEVSLVINEADVVLATSNCWNRGRYPDVTVDLFCKLACLFATVDFGDSLSS